MWIRSQSKETLLKVTKIFIQNNEIFANMEDGFDEMVGEYKSKERAIEVLDEIQTHISRYKVLEVDECLEAEDVVYQMPEE